MRVITAYGVHYLGCWWSEVRYRAAGYASEMKDVTRLNSLVQNFMKIRREGTELFHVDTQTDRQTDRERQTDRQT